MNLEPDSPRRHDDDGLAKRVDALVAWIDEIDARLRTAEVATGDQKTAKELRKAVEAAAKHDPKLEERVKNRVDVLGDRLETLATTVGTTSAALAAKDGDLVAVRKELAAAVTRMEALATDVKQASRDRDVELRKAVDKFSADHAKRKRSERDPEVDRKLAYLSERVDTLSTTVNESAAARATSRLSDARPRPPTRASPRRSARFAAASTRAPSPSSAGKSPPSKPGSASSRPCARRRRSGTRASRPPSRSCARR